MKNFICKAEEAPSSAKLLLQSQYELAKNASFFSFSALESLKENVLCIPLVDDAMEYWKCDDKGQKGSNFLFYKNWDTVLF